MGSIISLSIDRFEIDWGKNNCFINHSRLFLPDDIGLAPYHYVDEDTELPFVLENKAYVRPLGSVVKRLELLGYTIKECRDMYDRLCTQIPEYHEKPDIDFDLFAKAVSSIDSEQFRLPDPYWEWDLGEYVIKNILSDPEFTKTHAGFESLTREEGTFFENIDPYLTLRLLALNPANLNRLVVWRHADVVEGGWVEEDKLYEGLQEEDKYLIVTEGSTDTFILRKSLLSVQPEVADFFRFIDMKENYPFTGTGNLLRFCQGLAKINIQNKVVVIFDNDTAGRAAYEQVLKVSLPNSMTIMKLPSLPEFERIRTLGPSGEQIEDVNGRAVAIEAFLDLGFQRAEEPKVRWTSYDKTLGEYQGELIDKDSYVRIFSANMSSSTDYDLTKLSYLWKNILAGCGCSV